LGEDVKAFLEKPPVPDKEWRIILEEIERDAKFKKKDEKEVLDISSTI